MATVVKTYGWENVRSENVVGRNVQSGKPPSGKCPIGQVSVGELSLGKCQPVHEVVSVRELYGYQFVNETFSEELL